MQGNIQIIINGLNYQTSSGMELKTGRRFEVNRVGNKAREYAYEWYV